MTRWSDRETEEATGSIARRCCEKARSGMCVEFKERYAYRVRVYNVSRACIQSALSRELRRRVYHQKS